MVCVALGLFDKKAIVEAAHIGQWYATSCDYQKVIVGAAHIGRWYATRSIDKKAI